MLVGAHTHVAAQSFVTEKDRPDRSWIGRFYGAKKVYVKTTIENAIKQCPEGQYCELIISSLTLSRPISLSRSRTRLTGSDKHTIRIANTQNFNGFVFQIEEGTSEVIFSNLNIDGESFERDYDLFAIGAYGFSISKVLISDNRVHGLYSRENAHAVAFYGTGMSANDAIEHIIIQNNRIDDMRTGSSETIAINGNVRHWEVLNNQISHVNNIAIDAIGGEGTAPTRMMSDGRVAPGLLDAARLGFIENNTITSMSTETNPAYANQTTWAAAIYIDGAHSIAVRGNVVTDVPWGFEIGAENCITSSHVQMADNQSSNTTYGDILLGGYSRRGYLKMESINCDPHNTSDQTEGHGYVTNLDIHNNHLKGSKSTRRSFIGNTVIQHRVTHSNIEPPLLNLTK